MNRERAAHWVKQNHQERMPSRMVAFDTESRSTYDSDVESQVWRLGAAIRWRTDLKTGDHSQGKTFGCPLELWRWVSDYCRPGTRTVVWCHNLGYDSRVSQVFTILPQLGFHLEWCNLDRNVSSMTWRSDHGTLVFADTWTWMPIKLEHIAPQVGLVKYEMPLASDNDPKWGRYCMRDAEIVYHVVSRLVTYIKEQGLGNWQPTGAGMAMATWRHKFLHHQILVHDDYDILAAERSAMYTGRAEAWRHGKLHGDKWTEVDLRNAYVTIASECKLPRKLHMSTGAISLSQYRELRNRFGLLCYCSVSAETPILPYRSDNGILWPVGRFEGWYWDTEIECALRYGADIKIKRTYVYVEDYILKDWADWVLSILRETDDTTDPVVKTWVKHCARALIGRISLRTPSWQPFGDNPEGITGITYVTMPEENLSTRLLHVGQDTLIETHRIEGKDSLPQVTGKIMAECRVRLWEAMNAAGMDHLAHVDTDSVLVNSAGYDNLRTHAGDLFHHYWTTKGTYTALEIWGPRAYRRDKQRVTAGIPGKAEEQKDGSLTGERWASLSKDLNDHEGGTVTIRQAVWHIRKTDPRRRDVPGVGGGTRPYVVAGSEVVSDEPESDAGESATGGFGVSSATSPSSMVAVGDGS